MPTCRMGPTGSRAATKGSKASTPGLAIGLTKAISPSSVRCTLAAYLELSGEGRLSPSDPAGAKKRGPKPLRQAHHAGDCQGRPLRAAEVSWLSRPAAR